MALRGIRVLSVWLLGSVALPVAGCSVSAREDTRGADGGRVQRAGMTFEEFKSNTYREPDTGIYIVDGDVPIATEGDLERYYFENVRTGALIVHRVGAADAKWDDAQKLNLTYCVSTTFADKYDQVVRAMEEATVGAWERAANVRFIHLVDEDARCDAGNQQVVFDVRPTSGAPYLARAFFPSTARSERNILVNSSSFGVIAPWTLEGVLRHEVGHTLGFRHEHIHVASTGCREDTSWRELTPYDSASVMHYPQCKGTQRGDLVLTESDTDGAAILYNPRVDQVAVGAAHSCALLTRGKVECWGSNAHGELGDGTAVGRNAPGAVQALSGVVQIAAAGGHTCARLADGTVACWGSNSFGELGDGTTVDRTVPTLVPGVANVADIAAGEGDTCAKLTDGSFACWGRNANGQLGDGTTVDRRSPAVIGALSGADGVALGAAHSCARMSDGVVRCWGGNSSGQLGDGTTIDRLTPVAPTGLGSVTSLSLGSDASCALQDDGTASCWGTLGGAVPKPIDALAGASSLTVGKNGACAVAGDGTAMCWGANTYGAVGNGTTTDRSAPVAVFGPLAAAQVSTSGAHACALRSDGESSCWGFNGGGALGDRTFANATRPVSVRW